MPLLNRFTLIEFKGPTDVLERGDFAQLVGCAFLWHGQQEESVNHKNVSLIVLAPTISGPLLEELRDLGCEASQHENGIFHVEGVPFEVWLVETDVMAIQGEPILSLVSRIFLKERRRIIEQLVRVDEIGLLQYMIQFLEQPTFEEGFAMKGLADDPKAIKEDILRAILEDSPVRWREEMASVLSPEDRVRGLSVEERLAGLSDEEAAKAADLLKRRQSR